MTDYHVVHIDVARDCGAETGGRIQKECSVAAREGWFLHSIVPELLDGSTRGLWLVFATEGDDIGGGEAVATATEILSHAADEEQAAPGF
jgi:hypothetical protein